MNHWVVTKSLAKNSKANVQWWQVKCAYCACALILVAQVGKDMNDPHLQNINDLYSTHCQTAKYHHVLICFVLY